MAGQSRPIGPGALDADLGHVAEPFEPRQQRFVAGRVSGEALGAEQSAQRVQRRSDMDVSMGIDATGDPRRSFYDGHGHPFLSKLEGWHGRSGSERRAVGVVLATRANHPNSETGRAVFQCAAGRPRSTTSCNVTGLQVRPNLPALPKLFRTSSQAVDPQRSINELGQSHGRGGPTPAPQPGVRDRPLLSGETLLLHVLSKERERVSRDGTLPTMADTGT